MSNQDDLIARLRLVFTNEVIRAIGALARQQNVCREQAGQAVFVTGMEAAREYIVEQLACPGAAAEALAAASRPSKKDEDLDPRGPGERLSEGQDLPRSSQRGDAMERAEALWEELGGDLCICQRPDVPHWCENCQRRIDTIAASFRLLLRASASPAAPPPCLKCEERAATFDHILNGAVPEGYRPVSFASLMDSIDSKQLEETVYNLLIWHLRRVDALEHQLKASAPSAAPPPWQPIETPLKYTAHQDLPCEVCYVRIRQGEQVYRFGEFDYSTNDRWQHVCHVTLPSPPASAPQPKEE